MKTIIICFLTFVTFGCAGIDYNSHSLYEKNFKSYDNAKKCYEKLKNSENGKEAEELRKIILGKYDYFLGSEYVRIGIKRRLDELVKKAYKKQQKQERQKKEEITKENNIKEGES